MSNKIKELKKQVCWANLELVKLGLVISTWGNASAILREEGVIIIKPSGVEYGKMKPTDMVVVSLKSGEVVEGKLKPSSDTATHLELYRAFANIGGIVHTHSKYATAWAQAQRAIPALGTTHADYFYGEIPVTRPLSGSEIKNTYELNTGKVIIEKFNKSSAKIDTQAVPGVLVASHAPFSWGKTVHEAVHNALVIEAVAQMAINTININPKIKAVPQYLLDKHYFRKHGANAYYGQKK